MIHELQHLQIGHAQRSAPRRPWREALPRRKWLLVLALALPAALVVRVAGKPRVPSVETQTVTSATTASHSAPVLTAGGYVKHARVVYVVPRVPGRIVSLDVAEGDEIAEGALLATIDGGELAAQVAEAKADLRLAQANLARVAAGARPEEIAEAAARAEALRLSRDRLLRERERSRALLQVGVLPEQPYDQASTEAQVAENRLEAGLQRLLLLRAGPRRQDLDAAAAAVEAARARLTRAERQLEYTVIRAPFHGRVLKKYREVGDSVSPDGPFLDGSSTVAVGSPIVAIGQLEGLEAAADISETDMRRVTLNQPVEIVPSASPETTFHGKVTRIAPRADRNKGTIEVRVRFDEAPRPLAQDASVKLSFINEAAPARASAEPVRVPSRAVVHRGAARFVFVVEGGRARLRSVELGERQVDDTIAVKSGVTEGERLIVSGVESLEDGCRVELRPR